MSHPQVLWRSFDKNLAFDGLKQPRRGPYQRLIIWNPETSLLRPLNIGTALEVRIVYSVALIECSRDFIGALKALCIIPRTPSPVPLEERDVNDLNPDEMRELLRRQRVGNCTVYTQAIF